MELKVELRRRFVLIFRFESVDKKLNVERCPFTVLPYPGIHADYLGVGDLYSPVENQLPQIDSRAEFLYLATSAAVGGEKLDIAEHHFVEWHDLKVSCCQPRPDVV